MANNKTIILVGLGIVAVGGVAYYFITRKKEEEATTPAPYVPAKPLSPTTTKQELLNKLSENKDSLIYRGKVVSLAAYLKLGLQYAVTYKVAQQLKEFYFLLNGTPKSNPLLYGDVTEKTIDYYLLDMALHYKIRSQLKAI
jgi:hypothetical protein